jgi:hypothetical protein
MECAKKFEAKVGGHLRDLLPLDETLLIDFLLEQKEVCTSSTLNSYVSALGTISAWAGYERPRTSTVEYILKGE